MSTKSIITAFLLFLTVIAKAQDNYVAINQNIQLPQDSLEQIGFRNGLNSFLYAIKENKGTENWILPGEKSETQILADFIYECIQNDTTGSKPYLINAELFSDRKAYSIQIAYISLTNSEPAITAIVEFIAHKENDKFLFSSPLLRNTKEWNTSTQQHFIFHYQNQSAENLVNQYLKYLKEYDEMLSVTAKTDYYFCDDCESMTQMLRMAGILYSAEMNGFDWNSIGFTTEEKIINFLTQRQSRRPAVDPHNLFHRRAELAVPENNNYYMTCACANIYAGCWGLSWTEIKKMFKTKMTGNKKQDWLQLYYDRYNFGESNATYIFVTTLINGLIIEKTEIERGFEAVMSLIASGDMYKDRNGFFKILEEVTGINERNFNRKVEEIITDLLKDI